MVQSNPNTEADSTSLIQANSDANAVDLDDEHLLRSNRWMGRILVVVAAVMWSTSGFFAKAPIFEDWPIEIRGALLAFWRALFAAVAIGFAVRKVTWSWRLVPMVLLFSTMNWFYLTAMVYTEASIAIWLQSTAPVWVFFFSVAVFRERVLLRDWLLLLFGSLGVGTILFFEATNSPPLGLAFGLLSGVTYAGIVLTLRQLRDMDAAWLIFVCHAFTAMVLAPVVIYHNVWPSGSQWFYVMGFGILQMGIPYAIFARALQKISSHEASGIALLEPILVPVWVYLAWHHHSDYTPPAWSTIVGAIMILVGLLIRYARPIKSANSVSVEK